MSKGEIERRIYQLESELREYRNTVYHGTTDALQRELWALRDELARLK